MANDYPTCDYPWHETTIEELRQELAVARAVNTALQKGLRKIQEWSETCLALGATNAGLRRLISEVDDLINLKG